MDSEVFTQGLPLLPVALLPQVKQFWYCQLVYCIINDRILIVRVENLPSYKNVLSLGVIYGAQSSNVAWHHEISLLIKPSSLHVCAEIWMEANIPPTQNLSSFLINHCNTVYS